MINKDVLNKTRDKLIKINIIVVSGFLILFSLFTYVYFSKIVYSNVDKEIKNELINIVNQLERPNFLYSLKIDDPKDMVYVYKDEQLIYFTPSRYFEFDAPTYENSKINSFFSYSIDGYTFREFNYQKGIYNIRIIRNINSELSSGKLLLFVMLTTVILACILTYFIAVYLTKKALKPIEITWNNQAKFIQDASHELRTPITIISSKLEALLRHPDNTVTDELENIADAMNESRRLKKMINDLLTLTKEDYVDVVKKEEFDLEELINELCGDFFDLALIQNKTLKICSSLKDKSIISDRDKFRQLIIIFIDNAFKYTNEENYIKISLRQIQDEIDIVIEDNGIGIKKEELPNIFDRFFRSENVRDKDIDGSGIGLSIAKVLADSLDCRISVDSEYEKWTKFKITVPYDIS